MLRKVDGSVTVSASVSGQCSQACGLLSGGISQGGYTGSCTADAGVCDCTATRTIAIADNGQFTTNAAANTFTLVGTGNTFEYCVNGTQWATHDVDAGTGTIEPGYATLTHQN